MKKKTIEDSLKDFYIKKMLKPIAKKCGFKKNGKLIIPDIEFRSQVFK